MTVNEWIEHLNKQVNKGYGNTEVYIYDEQDRRYEGKIDIDEIGFYLYQGNKK